MKNIIEIDVYDVSGLPEFTGAKTVYIVTGAHNPEEILMAIKSFESDENVQAVVRDHRTKI